LQACCGTNSDPGVTLKQGTEGLTETDVTTEAYKIPIQADFLIADSYVQWRTQEFFSGRGGSTNWVEDRGQRERGSGVGSPLVKGSGGSCSLLQEISFRIVKFLNFWYFRLFMMTTNLFFIVNVKQLLTGGSFRILLPFFLTSWGVGVLNSAIFKLIRMLE